MKQKHKLWTRAIIIALSSILITLIFHFSKAFNTFENKSYDLRMTNAAKYKQPCEEICLIIVDQESIDWAKEKYNWSWPWPREAYGRMVDFISAGNPKAITFDILYTEPSIYGEEDDIALGAAEAKSKKVIQTFFYSAEDYGKTLMPVKPINDNAALLGNITSAKDSDDIIRRTRLFDTFNDTEYAINSRIYATGLTYRPDDNNTWKFGVAHVSYSAKNGELERTNGILLDKSKVRYDKSINVFTIGYTYKF